MPEARCGWRPLLSHNFSVLRTIPATKLTSLHTESSGDSYLVTLTSFEKPLSRLLVS